MPDSGSKKSYAASFILAGIAGFFLVWNVLMGPTIAANVMAVFAAIIFSVIGALCGVIQVIRKRTIKCNLVALLLNIAIVAYGVWLISAGKISAGYGP